jgi:adenylosuccinate synthase
MKSHHFNVVTDGQWGSCGKGLITTALAAKYRPELISTTNMANAGHTCVWSDGKKFIAKALPSASVLRQWLPDYTPITVVGPTAAFNLSQMLDEIQTCGANHLLAIHPRAGVITDEHKSRESDVDGTKHIASTMQGCGTFLSDKIMRRADLKLAKDYEVLSGHMAEHLPLKLATHILTKFPDILDKLAGLSLPMMLSQLMRSYGCSILHEGSQGFSLDINHGSHYPQCTSRGTTALQNLADMGLPATQLGDVYLVIRPAPIRVGNVIEDGKTVGYSGDCYDDHHEVTWADIAKEANAPPEVTAGELTTVTKRLRRVFSFSKKQFVEAATINGATKIALNFANYVDWSCYGTKDPDNLPPKVINFIHMLEDLVSLPVTIIGTGPQNDHVCFIE